MDEQLFYLIADSNATLKGIDGDIHFKLVNDQGHTIKGILKPSSDIYQVLYKAYNKTQMDKRELEFPDKQMELPL